MRDWTGAPSLLNIEDDAAKDAVIRVDRYLRDMSRGVQRIQLGQIPDGSGTNIIDVVVSKKYWYKPGDSPFGTAFMDTSSGGGGIISSTSHATKGFIDLGGSTGLRYNETSVRVGLAVAAPTAKLHMDGGLPAATPSSDSTVFANTWQMIGGTTWTECVNTNDGAGNYASRTDATGTYSFAVIMSGSAPASSYGSVITIVARRTGTLQAGTTLQLGYVGSDGVEYVSAAMDINTFFTLSFVSYNISITSATGFTALPAGRVRFTTNNGGASLGLRMDITYAEISGTSDTLQKWATGSTLDQLDFGSDGAGGTDMILSGNAELFINVGDAASGLRLYTLTDTAYLEAGKTDSTNKNLTLGGIRASQGTLLKSNFVNTQVVGTIEAQGDIFRNGGTTLNITAGEIAFNINSGPTDILTIGQSVEINRDDNATVGTPRLVVHASPGQTGDMIRIRNAADNANLAVFTSDGRLGIGADPTAGIELDITGDTRGTLRQAWTPLAISLTSNPVAWTAPTSMWQRVTSNVSDRLISGIDATGAIDGQIHGLINIGTNRFILAHQAAGASATNRIISNTSANLIISSLDMAWVMRDATTDRWRAWKYLTPNDEIIIGTWEFGGDVTFDAGFHVLGDSDFTGDVDITGTLTLIGDTVSAPPTTSPKLVFQDSAVGPSNGFTQTIYSSTDTASGSLYALPAANGGSHVFVMADLQQTITTKTISMQSLSASSGSNFHDLNTTTKRLRFVLADAVGNNSMTLKNTAARDYIFTNQSGGVATDANIVCSGGEVVVSDDEVVLNYG